MLTQQEIFEEAISLPYEERDSLVRNLTKTLRNGNGANRRSELSVEERKTIVDRLRGIASVPGKVPPTDQEARKDYHDYLSEKYS